MLLACRGYTPQYGPARNITRLTLGDSLATRPDQTVYKQPPENYDSLVTQRAGQTDDKAQGPEGRFMLMVGRFKRKGVFPLQGVKTRTCIRFVLEDRLVLILIGLHM